MKNKGKIPVIMASGYLGAGKTTLLSFLLNSEVFLGKKIAVLVNEFGQLPIDGALLPQGDYFLTEINKGSIFCVCVKTDLLRDLDKIAGEIQPDLLLIEATGVAEPKDISLLMDTPFLQESYGESVIITLVDAINFPKLSSILPALSTQVATADILLLNKVDCVDKACLEKTEREIRKLNPTAKIHHTIKANFPFDPKASFDSKLRQDSKTKLNLAEPGAELCQAPPPDVHNCEFRTNEILNRVEFYDFLNEHRNRILRGKGIVDFKTDKKYVEIVNGTLFTRPASAIHMECEYKSAMSFVLHGITPEEFLTGVNS